MGSTGIMPVHSLHKFYVSDHVRDRDRVGEYLMKRYFLLCAVAAAALAFCTSGVHADTLSHEFMPGHGDPQDFAVSNSIWPPPYNTTGIQVGLAAQPRYSGPAVTKSGNTYYVQPGTIGGKAVWNFDYSIDTNPNDVASPQYSLDDLYVQINISGAGVNDVFYPLVQPTDNSSVGETVANTLAQNSENLNFSIFGSSPYHTLAGFDPNTPGNYLIQLFAFRKSDNQTLVSAATNVTVVPLPSAACGGLALLGGLGVIAVRRRRQTTMA
jgi:hypothetical protein